MGERKEDGPAFPTASIQTLKDGHEFTFSGGVTLRDYFAIHAPQPTDQQISRGMDRDKNRNPYNEPGKPKLREREEIIAALRYEFADAMLRERSK